MSNVLAESIPFFSRPILNSPYKRPELHWELDASGQPTQSILSYRRPADFITPIPKPKKRRSADQEVLGFEEGDGISTKGQQYETRSIINEVRGLVESWRNIQQQALWQVTPETARLLHHWRHYEFGGVRPFSVRSKRLKRRYGWQKSLHIRNQARGSWSIWPRPIEMPIPTLCALH